MDTLSNCDTGHFSFECFDSSQWGWTCRTIPFFILVPGGIPLFGTGGVVICRQVFWEKVLVSCSFLFSFHECVHVVGVLPASARAAARHLGQGPQGWLT
jgi:hypothetical protein